jgi:ribonuclease HI
MIEALGLSLLTGFAITIAWIVGRALWGTPEEGGSEWESALADELPPPFLAAPAPTRLHLAQRARDVASEERVIAMRAGTPAVPLVEVIHEGASEAAPAPGAIGTMAATPSDDLLTFAEQVAGAPAEWAGFTQALVAYEDAMLTRHTWYPAEQPVCESAQQRIDRWLSEGGVGVESARSEVRQAVSETWDSPSRELALVDRPDAERVAEAALTA